MEPLMATSGSLPIDALQTLFTMLDPHGVGDKYRNFATADKTTPRAKRFVAMEDWLADGVPLAAPVARETLAGWYGANTTAHGAWRVAGLAVDPACLTIPSFCAIPGRDRLVPPESAAPLFRIIKKLRGHPPASRPYRHDRRNPRPGRTLAAFRGLAARRRVEPDQEHQEEKKIAMEEIVIVSARADAGW